MAFELLLKSGLVQLKHLNVSGNQLLKERGVNTIVKVANSFAASELSMLQVAECGLDS